MTSSQPTTIVRARYHQAAKRFGLNAGRQCVAMCAQFLVANTKIDNWTTNLLTNVINEGDKFYTTVLRNRPPQYLSIDAILNIEGTCVANGRTYKFEFTNSSDVLSEVKDTDDNLPIKANILSAFEEKRDDGKGIHLIIIFGERAYACVKKNGFYMLFDSHSRSSEGLSRPCGASAVLVLTTLKDLLYFLLSNEKNIRNFQVGCMTFRITDEVGFTEYFGNVPLMITNNESMGDERIPTRESPSSSQS